MNLNIDPDWLLKAADKEAGKPVSVGGLITDLEKAGVKKALGLPFYDDMSGVVDVYWKEYATCTFEVVGAVVLCRCDETGEVVGVKIPTRGLVT